MQRKQLWTKISGGLMSLFVLVNIISCGNIHHDDTGTVTSGWVSKESGTTEDLRGIAWDFAASPTTPSAVSSIPDASKTS